MNPILSEVPSSVPPAEDLSALERAVDKAYHALLKEQRADGHFVFPLEADATIPAEYILLEHYLDRINPELEEKMCVYLRRIQGKDGGWPLFTGGKPDISATVKAYFALKIAGEDINAPHMVKAREVVLALGGAERANVFTRIQLALFGDVPWRAVPVMPVEIMLLPKAAPFHMSKISYWSRTVIAPLLILMALKPQARNPRNIHVPELFKTPPDQVKDYIKGPDPSFLSKFFAATDSILRKTDPFMPGRLRKKATEATLKFIRERLNGLDGLGAIYPAMANSVMMFDALGYPADHPEADIAWKSVQTLIIEDFVNGKKEAWVQPCVSPVWDTALAAHALLETKEPGPSFTKLCQWLTSKQITEFKGDWADERPNAVPGGWAFQYNNVHYPDVDDTAVVGMALHREGDPAYREAIEKARQWIIGMQSRDGGWGAFDADNTHYKLNHIPFADHGALLDPPTVDVTARCVSFLCQLGYPEDRPVIDRALAYLRSEQEPDGSWFGRWGTNYIYGTWSALLAFNAAGIKPEAPEVRKAVKWLLSCQREDGGFGEDCETYFGTAPAGLYKESTPSHTAWALIALEAAGEAKSEAARRAAEWLISRQKEDGTFDEVPYNAVGFPRVFYLHYYGYKYYFPLLALARYRNLLKGNQLTPSFGF